MLLPKDDGAKSGPQIHTSDVGDSAKSPLSLVATMNTTGRSSDDITENPRESQDVTELHKISRTRQDYHTGEAYEYLPCPMSAVEQPLEDQIELGVIPARHSESSATRRPVRNIPPERGRIHELEEEAGSPTRTTYQGVPREIGNFTAEVIFVFVCSAGLLMFTFLYGDIIVNQEELKRALSITNSELPWLLAAYTLPLSLSVVISGSLSDLTPPRMMMIGAFAWMTVWNVVGVFSFKPSMAILFYIVRAMQGLSVGVLVSCSMSILGRVYNPGRRKSQVFSAMAATSPFGFWLGAIQGGALKAHLKWIFVSNAILSTFCSVAAYMTIPPLKPVADIAGTEVPTIWHFDYIGASLAISGCVCMLFGLTQGSVAEWSLYTYLLVIVGTLLIVAFFFVERWVKRPLIPNQLWKTKGFAPLMIAYFLGFGAFSGAWQFYAVQFWLRVQHAAPIIVALYLLPNAIVGVLATWVVSKTLHVVPGHYIYLAAMVAFALGPIFFLPQTSGTTYWALSFPGVALTTFGPDLSFAAASIYITSNVRRSYQGSAGSLLVTVQNLSTAVMASLADAIGNKVDKSPSGDIGLKGLQAIWWFGLAAEIIAALITLIWVRVPKEEEKEHIL